MGILFVISIAALLALLWAAFSIARHIRRARRRRRNAVLAVAATRHEEFGSKASQHEANAVMHVNSESESAEKIQPERQSQARDLSALKFPASGILGSTFTGRSPKI